MIQCNLLERYTGVIQTILLFEPNPVHSVIFTFLVNIMSPTQHEATHVLVILHRKREEWMAMLRHRLERLSQTPPPPPE